ncbi:MAG: CPBP family intramembrane metalloprotease [Deltaproteobacteria bacterium]|nr:CPBP family intramembrane metalloprotease [Deltaproteobacteria bacterium]
MNARQSLISGGSLEERSRPTGFRQSRIVRLEGTLAVGLVAGAIAWSWVRDLGVLGHLRAGGVDLLIGLLSASALCLSLPFFTSAWASRVLLLREMKGVWDDLLTPFGKSLTLAEISALAVLSGVSEEIFFRGAVQGEFGILAAGVLFGLLHPLNLSYVVWASCVGLAFGVLFQLTGSLLPPIICHSGYNLAALLYLRYWYLGESRDRLLLAR